MSELPSSIANSIASELFHGKTLQVISVKTERSSSIPFRRHIDFMGRSRIRVTGFFLNNERVALFMYWKTVFHAQTYELNYEL
jgi:hypothetical protein